MSFIRCSHEQDQGYLHPLTSSSTQLQQCSIHSCHGSATAKWDELSEGSGDLRDAVSFFVKKVGTGLCQSLLGELEQSINNPLLQPALVRRGRGRRRSVITTISVGSPEDFPGPLPVPEIPAPPQTDLPSAVF